MDRSQSIVKCIVASLVISIGCFANVRAVAQEDGAGERAKAIRSTSSTSSEGNAPALIQRTANAGQKNSTKKYRVQPSRLAQKAGLAIHWMRDFEQALSKSKASGKPIFWYVPSVRKTFMDRKAEIDRYMLAGPFSWPANIDLINREFIPLRQIPDVKESQQFGITVYQFIEPGFLIIKPDLSVSLKADRLTTTNPQWFYQNVASKVGVTERQWDCSRWGFLDPRWPLKLRVVAAPGLSVQRLR